MGKLLKCRDLGFDCDAEVRGESVEDILAVAGPHAQSVHGLEVDDKLVAAVTGAITDE